MLIPLDHLIRQAPLQRRIAVVDDDLGVRQALDRLLRSAGYRVTAFASAEEFLAKGRSIMVDCLVLDVHLGGMTGFELEERLNADGIGLPVVLMTAHDDSSVRLRLQQSHAGAVLQKPFEDDALLGAIELVMRPGAEHRAP
jgi:FixJ family two-component response regulator